jgi:cytochrome P450
MNYPPGPTTPPLLQTYQYLERPHEFLAQCAARYGEIFRIRLMKLGDVVVVANPDAIKEVFAISPELLLGGKANEFLRPFLGEHSLFALDGAEHLRQRKLLMPAFHGDRMHAYGQQILDLAHAMIDTWTLQQPFALQSQMMAVTLRIILRIVFGIVDEDRASRLFADVSEMFEHGSNPLVFSSLSQRDVGESSPWRRFRRLMAQVDGELQAEIERRRAEKPGASRTDILSLLLEARDEQGEPMAFQELRDELVTLLVAGHETTAVSLSWTMCGLLADPDLWVRLRLELAAAVEGDRLIPERLTKLDLLDATVREGLRMRPAASLVMRTAQQPLRIGGYDVPAGWVVAPAVYLAHHRSAAFPEPGRFDPDRYSRSRPSPNEWLPFGGGDRRCIGAAFATYQMKLVLAAILWRTKLRIQADYTPRAIHHFNTVAPSHGVPVILDERRPTSRVAAPEQDSMQ